MTTPRAIAHDPLATLTPPMRWLLERSTPDEPALAQITPTATLDSLYSSWMKSEEFASAIRLIAAVLPPRESIWWAWVSARHATQTEGGTAANTKVHAALTAVERWVVQPDDAARRSAWDAGNAAGLDTPIGMVGAAVFLSGTTVAPAHVPPVPPPPGVTMPLIAGAITLAAASITPPEQVQVTMAAFAAQGLEIIKRLNGWDAALHLAYESQQRQQIEYDRVTNAPFGG